ncbi:IS66 family insertion sequence element accessory protein TnpB [Hallella colorans]|nr:IS66 family insertion sequence element accessory protein TnpB [Hallella colorans]
MRQGVLSLSQLVSSDDFNPSNGIVYILYNLLRSRIKLPHWECRGSVVYHKRMAQNCLSPKTIRQDAGF